MKKGFSLLLFIAFFTVSKAQIQDRTNAFLFGAGLGMSDGNNLMGNGTSISVAYMRSFKYNRLSFKPELNIGFYGARFITDVPDMYFNSINIDFNFHFDAIRYKGVSLSLVAGPAINQKKGLIGTGGWPASENSEYSRSSDFVFKFGGGIKIMPPGQKIIVELMPMNFRVGKDYFMEACAMIYLGYIL